jgi:Uma2 family endonuclease
LTAEEFLALDVDTKAHLELLDGALVLTPRPLAWHNLLVCELLSDLGPQLPAALDLTFDMDVIIDVTGRVMRPDVLVVRKEAILAGTKPWAKDTLLVLEVVSPGSTYNDRRTKRDVYAAAGLDYWRIEAEDRRLALYRHWPDDREIDRAVGSHTETIGPVELTVDLDDLTARIAKFLP